MVLSVNQDKTEFKTQYNIKLKIMKVIPVLLPRAYRLTKRVLIIIFYLNIHGKLSIIKGLRNQREEG